jgi:hypothetical protein
MFLSQMLAMPRIYMEVKARMMVQGLILTMQEIPITLLDVLDEPV